MITDTVSTNTANIVSRVREWNRLIYDAAQYLGSLLHFLRMLGTFKPTTRFHRFV